MRQSILNILSSRPVLSGCLAAGAVVLIWAMWLVVSRAGAQSTLNAYDLTAIRYGVAAVASLPIVLYYKPWRNMSLARIAGLSFLLGPLYILCVYFAFDYAPAAHGGVYMNGVMPAITLLLSFLFLKQKSTVVQLLGVGLIFSGTLLTAADVSGLSIPGAWRGDLLFLVAAVFFSAYLVVARAWSVTPAQVMLCGSLINAIIFVPVWYWWLPSGLAEAERGQLALQLFYQGLIPGLLGLVLVAVATKNIGPAATSAFIAAVPGLGAVLGVVFLNEVPGVMGWLSLAVLTAGILMVSLGVRRNSA